jgi:hypothetical protein
MDSFGFIIAACLHEHKHLISLNDCIQSIRRHNPFNKIVVVMDYSSKNDLKQESIQYNPEVIFELNTPNIPADMLMLHYYKENKYFDKAILLQDSMRIKQTINASEVKDIQYLWYFTNHRTDWHKIPEPQTEFNCKEHINNHDDLNSYIIKNLITEPKFKEYCEEYYSKKEMWCGCFGTCCILTHEFLETLDKMTNIIAIQKQMNTNRLRRAIESIFSLACQYVTQRDMSNAYDGLYYDGKGYHNNMNGTFISKISFCR